MIALREFRVRLIRETEVSRLDFRRAIGAVLISAIKYSDTTLYVNFHECSIFKFLELTFPSSDSVRTTRICGFILEIERLQVIIRP